MKKFTMLVYHRELSTYLNKLQKLGVLHIVEKEEPSLPDSIMELKSKLVNFEMLIKNLNKFRDENKIVTLSEVEQLSQKVAEEDSELYTNLNQEIEKNNTLVKQLKKEISYLKPWGDFSISKINEVLDSGIEFKLFQISESKFNEEWQTKLPLTITNKSNGIIYFVIHHLKSEEIDIKEITNIAEEFYLPKKSISELEHQIKECEGESLTSKNELIMFTKEKLNSLIFYKDSLGEELDFAFAKHNSTEELEGKLKILEGWIPTSQEKELEKFLDSEKIVFNSNDPVKNEHNIPIKLENNKFTTLFEPIGKLFSLPAYQEIDLTPMFAPFFMFFFGFCLGDAGYGAVILLAATIAKFKVGKNLKSVLSLLQVLGFATVLMGTLGGTVFGINLITKGIFSDKIFFTNKNLYFLAVVIGIVQILFGMIVKAANAIKQRGHIYAFSTYGWILMLISLVGGGMGFLLLNFGGYSKDVIDGIAILPTLTTIAKPTFFVGLALLLLFSNPDVNIFKRFGLGLWEFYGITGLLGDVLSYLRLYALGLSSGILGLVINQLGTELILDAIHIPVLNYVIFIIFLVVAHSGNLLLSFLGSFVHPMRLTFVEFYKNAGWEGGGTEYKPFSKVVKNNN